MSNGSWRALANEDASNKTIVAALHKYIVKHCKNQQYQMSEVTWRNFCLKVADSLCNDYNNNKNEYDCNKIINYIYNNNIANIDHRISYSINDNNNTTTNITLNNKIPNNSNTTTPKVCIYYLKYFLTKYHFIFSSTELCAQEPSYLVRSNVHLSICKDFLGKEGCHSGDCKDLHCCKYFILENCKFADNCSFGHNIRAGRNKEILERNYIFLDDESDANKRNNNNNTTTTSKYHINNTLSTTTTTTRTTTTTTKTGNDCISPITNSNNNNTYNTPSTHSTTTNNNTSNHGSNNTSNHGSNNTSNHANTKLRKQIDYLAHYSIADLSFILRRDCPRICKFYNTDSGCKYGSEGKKCPALHLCREVVMGGKCASERCRLNHSLLSGQVSGLLCRQGFIINEYTKESSIFSQLKASEEAADLAANPPPPNPLINNSISHSISSQPLNQPTTSVFSLSDSMMQQHHYDSPTHNLPSQANGLYDNMPDHYDNQIGGNLYDVGALLNQMEYFEEEEMVENEEGLYADVYNNHDSLYNNQSYNNNEELNDDCYLPVFYPNNYLHNNKENSFYASATKDNNNFFHPPYSKESNNYYQPQQLAHNNKQQQQQRQSSFLKSTSMTLRQQHLRQCKRMDNSRLRVCKYYNVERGCKYFAKHSQYCPNLHLCHHFVAEKCIYGGEKCRRSHNIHDPSVRWVLQSNNVDVSMPTDNILEEIRRRLNMTDDSPSSDSESEDDLRTHHRISSPFTTRSTLTPTASEFTPSKSTNLSTPQTTPKNNQNSNNKNTGSTTTTSGGSNSSNKLTTTTNNHPCIRHPPSTTTPMKPRTNKINTFVFLDLEATGFHQSKITELSLVAVHRLSIEAALDQPISNKSTYLPRIINKLTICVNPGKPIERRAAEITGMNSGMLDKQGGFSDHTADLILLFIHALEHPCCLVAHNGRGFDFPLLHHELSTINRHIPFDLYCVDSLVLFRSLCSEEKRAPRKATRKVTSDKTSTPSKALPITSPNGTPISIYKSLESDDADEVLKAPKDTLSKHLSSSLDKVEGGKAERIDWWGCSDVEDSNHHHHHHLSNGHHDNKISPNKLFSSTSNLTLHPPAEETQQQDASKFAKTRTDWWGSDDEEEEDEDGLRGPKKHNGIKGSALKGMGVIGNGLNGPSHEVLQSKSSEGFVVSRTLNGLELDDVKVKKKLSYKLAEIHKRVTGEYPHQVHRAEDDSEALLRCFMFTPGALQWADNNAIPFSLPSNQPPAL